MPTMSEQRQAIAAALTVDVDGYSLVGSTYAPDVVTPLRSWPSWDSTVPENACAAVTTWRVLLALPGGNLVTWDDCTDSLVQAVTEALYSLGRVLRVEPVTYIAQDTSGYPCLQFTVEI
jgi:hypothetical protein